MQEFRVADEASEERIAQATLVAYQTVKCWVMTKNKGRMPTFKALLPSAREERQSGKQMGSLLHVLAQQHGGKIVKVHRRTKG